VLNSYFRTNRTAHPNGRGWYEQSFVTATLNRPTVGERWQQKTCDAGVHVGLITSADMVACKIIRWWLKCSIVATLNGSATTPDVLTESRYRLRT
jgi:hypothetical protein